jgi:hypothetical protein
MMHVWLILENYYYDDDESVSSDESLSIEFPPPPREFSSSSVPDDTYQFVPVKNPLVQTMIIRSDSGKHLQLNSFKQFCFCMNFIFVVSIIIINLS